MCVCVCVCMCVRVCVTKIVGGRENTFVEILSVYNISKIKKLVRKNIASHEYQKVQEYLVSSYYQSCRSGVKRFK